MIVLQVMEYVLELQFHDLWWENLDQIWNNYFYSCDCQIVSYKQTKFNFNWSAYTEKYRNQLVVTDSVVHVRSPYESLQLYKTTIKKIKYPLL